MKTLAGGFSYSGLYYNYRRGDMGIRNRDPKFIFPMGEGSSTTMQSMSVTISGEHLQQLAQAIDDRVRRLCPDGSVRREDPLLQHYGRSDDPSDLRNFLLLLDLQRDLLFAEEVSIKTKG